MNRNLRIALLVAAIAAGTGTLAAQSLDSGLRGPTPLNDEGPASPMTPTRNTAEREVRNYPEQPPVIPHSIDGYQIDLQTNKCLSCHARARTGESQAPMVSILTGSFAHSSRARCFQSSFSAHFIEQPNTLVVATDGFLPASTASSAFRVSCTCGVLPGFSTSSIRPE